ncbi:phosphodiester glycosidase family protein [Paenibacillus sp. CMAA1739]|uniref:phosphodiester glycosidase family protein n=1 Tax=Paenibacillus ottowii TaxID=2315729 RepID=UPI002DBA4A23|nr:phosphodiester glycosidase family protein [Paenibacillus sp. CMAA1739]MEC4567037.1 phosphodiester glycosidase family protein [Paenibacillus sp. CMAA1739]
MNIDAKLVNRFFMLALAPFIGLLGCILLVHPPLSFPESTSPSLQKAEITLQTQSVGTQLDDAKETAAYTLSTIRRTSELYKQTTQTMNQLVATASTQSKRPEVIYNRRITAKLGIPYERVDSNRITIELFKVNPGIYHGYAMKVKLKDPTAMKMSLGNDKLGGSETTLRAVLRHGAVAGINAGGFADGDGKRYPLSTTVLNGRYLTGFQSSFKDLSFVGLSNNGKLIGGKFYNQDILDSLKPAFGATFVPVLLQKGQKVPVPDKWRVSPKRAPRTVIGNYKDDQLLIIIVDGYDESGGSGATLEELQGKMYNLGVQDAYNLDGGGSSSLILNGRVVNKPSDGNLRPVPTHFLFYK